MLIVVSLLSWVYSLSCLLLRFVARLPIMSSLARRISQRVGFFVDTRTPLAPDGARPQSGTVERVVDDLIQLNAVTHTKVGSFFYIVAHIMTNFKPGFRSGCTQESQWSWHK